MKFTKLILSILFISFITILNAQIAPIDKNGLAIGGYDVVAYFSNTATMGDAAITVEYQGATYQFVNTANQETFKKNPSRFLPQYNGYCAWGVGAKNSKFPINPETFDIVEGKLYLFFNGPFNGKEFNTLEPWNSDKDNLLRSANENWKTLETSK